ncbi:homoserine kinase [Dermabacteraceae bacterium TAE3-ERU27]|nr:homoserine kinase [Dermabacteraceae bacterium TAE3-ERU27]
MRIVNAKARVSVPATSANLGPAFDCAGLALELCDDLSLEAVAGGVNIEISGEGAQELPRDENHLVVRALRRTLDAVGAPQIGVNLTCVNRIPHGRGLGSSAAATLAGILLARGLISDPEVLDERAILQLATEFEGHPDNAAPALLGGVTLAWGHGDRLGFTRLALREGVSWPVTVLVPENRLSTESARGLLPESVPHADAAFAAGRGALLSYALTSAPELLFDATVDVLHQEYRAPGMPESVELVRVLRSQGYPAAISGAGPTVIVFAQPGQEMRETVRNVVADPQSWRVASPGLAAKGALQRLIPC